MFRRFLSVGTCNYKSSKTDALQSIINISDTYCGPSVSFRVIDGNSVFALLYLKVVKVCFASVSLASTTVLYQRIYLQINTGNLPCLIISAVNHA